MARDWRAFYSNGARSPLFRRWIIADFIEYSMKHSADIRLHSSAVVPLNFYSATIDEYAKYPPVL